MEPTPHKSNNIRSVDLEKRLSKLESEVVMIKKAVQTKKSNDHKKLIFWLSSILIVVSSIFFVFSIAGYWLKSNIVNTDVWVSKTSEVIQTPSVRSDVSTSLSNAIFSKFDVNGYVSDLLPDRAKPLAGPISNNLQSFTQTQINKIMQSQAFIKAWEKLNRQAHSGLINSLQKAQTNSLNNNDLLYFSGDNLMLNINPVYTNIKTRLSSGKLSAVSGVLPDSVNKQIKIATVKQMPTVLFAFNIINKAALLMIIPMLIFGIGGLLLAKSKRKGLMIFGISSIILLILNVQSVYLAQYPFISGLNNALQNSNSASATAIFNIYTKDLVYYDRIAIVSMLVLVLFAFLAGPAKSSVWIRTQISKIFESKSDYPAVKWTVKNTNYIITGLLIATFLLTVFPLINSVWYLLTLFVVVGIICIALLSLKSSTRKPKKRQTKKTTK
ncbi:MAG: hypothetical protein NTV39_02985 [Candidatus Saccharibacteria bacterium]|nr:hypothetical protein [Candidatus Saccharibacteria bacterium]